MGAEPDRTSFVRQPEPRLFDEATAAAYLGISKSGFRSRWEKRELPQPLHIGHRVLWDRKQLDRFVDALSGIEAEPEGWEL